MSSYRFFYIFIINLFCFSISNYCFSQGLKTDVDFYELNKDIKKVDLDLSRSLFDLPSSINLNKYLPYTHHQGDIGMCVAYAITTARTILYARDNNIINQDQISYESFSPNYTYIYNKKITGDTITDGMYFNLNLINESGFVKIRDLEFPNYYPFSTTQIFSFPDLKFLNKENNKYKFSSFEILDLNQSNRKKIKTIKKFLSDGNPAIIGFKNWPNILNESSNIWELIEKECKDTSCVKITNDTSGFCKIHKTDDWSLGGGHALLIIGYDNQINGGSFLLHNSYGNSWGDNGNMWISYDDFFDHLYFLAFCFTNRELDFERIINEKDKFGAILDISISKEFNELDFNWSSRFPLVNNFGVYKGEYKNDLREGFGEFTALNSTVFRGNWQDDLPNGSGLLEFPNGNVIDAQWQDFFMPNFLNFNHRKYNIIYEGYWNSSLMIPMNKGKISYLDSTGKFSHAFEGFFDNSWYVDKSQMFTYFEDDWKYTGEWKEDYFHGEGTLEYSDGWKYTGSWKDDKRDGQGTLEYSDGWKYIGNWKNGKQHGKGKQIDNKGNIEFDGQWENGNFIE